MQSLRVMFQKSLPLLGVLFLQAVIAVKDIIFKLALNEGMSSYVLVTYRFGLATVVMAPFAWALERNTAPKNDDAYLSQHHIVEPVGVRASLTLLSYIECIYVFTLGFFSYKLYRPVGDGILYTLSIKYTTATFVAAMSNILPAATFVLACVFRSVDPSHSKT